MIIPGVAYQDKSTGICYQEMIMQKWEYCTVYQVSQIEGWITGFGMIHQGGFTDQGAVRKELEHNPDA
jgi:hypothetical protein